VALAGPTVEDLTFRSGRELLLILLLSQLQAQHTVAPRNPDFARRLGGTEFVMAHATCSCDELGDSLRVSVSVGIHGREPLVIVVVAGKEDIGVCRSKDPPRCI
jgi:hypothetical protein